jgi:hypothetical protein
MWIITAWQHISPEITVEGFKKCFISKAMDQTDDDMLRCGSEEDGTLRTVSVRKMKALTEDADSDADW